jgi:hypothetical protein
MQRLFATAAATSQALRAADLPVAADRLERCANARRLRTSSCRGWACRTSWCPWCARPLLKRWMNGIRVWVGEDDISTLRVPVHYEPGRLREAVRVLRRALRDLRDRRGRRLGEKPWRSMSVGGLLGARGWAVLYFHHPGISRSELLAVLARRWPGSNVIRSDHRLAVDWALDDRVELARIRRGAEPLRIVVPAQRLPPPAPHRVRTGVLQPLPVIFA